LMSGTWLYALDVERLDIPSLSGLSRETVLRNYKAVIDFLNPFSKKEFSMPDLAASENGVAHFEDCKTLMTAIYLIGAAALLFLVVILIARAGRIRTGSYLAAAVTALALPAAVGAYIAIDFERAFILFHKIFFSNDYWVFDPATDPVITILPERYFMHCGIFIVFFWLLTFLLFLILYLRKRKRPNKY